MRRGGREGRGRREKKKEDEEEIEASEGGREEQKNEMEGGNLFVVGCITAQVASYERVEDVSHGWSTKKAVP